MFVGLVTIFRSAVMPIYMTFLLPIAKLDRDLMRPVELDLELTADIVQVAHHKNHFIRTHYYLGSDIICHSIR